MKLNAVEKVLMNNPVRSAVQRWYEVPLLRDIGGSTCGERVLEIGCGRGVRTEQILRRFDAASVIAIDLDPDMVRRARARLARFESRCELRVGDASVLDFGDDSFDAVFDFGIIHHAPNWRAGLAEVHRVLKPGGRFYFEEVTSHALNRWSYRTFLDHPTHDRFSTAELLAACNDTGLNVADQWTERFFGDFVIGVAMAQPPPGDDVPPARLNQDRDESTNVS